MNSEKLFENKKEDNKALKKFIPLLLISMIVGGIAGGLSVSVENDLAKTIAVRILDFLIALAPYANLILTIFVGGTAMYLYKKALKLYKTWDGEEEELIDQIEILLSYAQWTSAILMILTLFFLAVGFRNVIVTGEDISVGIMPFLTNVILVVVSTIIATCVTVILQQKIINLEKEINPEKKGSVFDVKFVKKWIESCDEAERLNIYQSAYKSYVAVSKTCLILWVFATLGMMYWDIGVIPITLVTIIWLVQTTSYCMESIRLAKKSIKNKNILSE